MKLRKIFFTMLAAALFICVSPRMSAYATNYTVPAGETGGLGGLTSPPSSWPVSITLFPGDTLTIQSGATLTMDFGDTLTIEQGASVIVKNSGIIENNGTIINRGTMSGESGAELRNQALGVIDNNTVTITTNAGKVTNNNGKVTNNNGTITNNAGTVTNNAGTITANTVTGTVEYNFHIIDTNAGTVNDNAVTGTVENNFRIIDTNAGTVNNNFIGPDNSIGTSSGTVNNNYYQVTITGGEHTTNGLTAENNQLWLKSGGSATFSPQPGYVIKNAVSNNSKAAFTSSSGVWTLTDNGTNPVATAVTLTVEELPASSVPHTGSDRQTGLMLSLALLSGAVLLSGVIKGKKRA